MSLRILRPYKAQEDNDATTNNTNQLGTQGTAASSQPRSSSNKLQKPSRGTKGRRKPEHVIQNACLNCKRRRAKCDGKEPCGKCIEKPCDQECSYQPHSKHVKTELVESLKSHHSWKRNAERIFHAIEANENIFAIIERVQNHESVESIAQWLQATNGDFKSPSPTDSSHFMMTGSDNEMDDGVSPRFRWSSVTANEHTVQHLFTLYFTWVHPFHMLFDEQLFVHSYQQRSEAFCSSSLVNAICAMACCYHTAIDTDTTDFELLGRDFSEAVRHELDAEDESLLSAQVFAIMFLAGCTQGKGLHASKYLTVATNSMASLECVGDNVYQRAWRCTARGINCLNIEWAQMTFQVPLIVNMNPPSNSNLDDEERDMQTDKRRWAFYRNPLDNKTEIDWHPSLTATIHKEKAKLLDVVYDVEILLYSSGGPPISAQDILNTYHRFITWRADLPRAIGNTSNKPTQLLPHALSMLILYNTAVVQLLRPLLDLKGFPIYLVDHVVWQHAQYGLSLLEEHYHTLDICRYQPVVQMFAILHLTDVIARFFPNVPYNHGKDGPAAVRLAIDVLAKSRPGFPVAGTFLELIHKTAKDVIIPLPNDLEESFHLLHPSRSKFLLGDVIDACTRTTYTQPVHNIHTRFSPTISSNWAATCTTFGFRQPGPDVVPLRQLSAEEQGAQNIMQITNLLNMDG